MIKHTPGPWTADFDDQVPARGRVYVEGPRGWNMQPICAVDYGSDVGQNEADARLITAAPELLALVQQYRETVAYHIRVDTNKSDEEGANLKRFTLATIDAAIAKAEGRS